MEVSACSRVEFPILETAPASSSCRSLAACCGGLSTWQIGVGMTSLKGTIVSTADPLYEPIRFSENGYEAFGVVTFAQLEKGPDETVERLLGRFGRAMTGRLAKWPTEVGKSPAAKS